jgi:hypothetical protein
MVSATLFVCTVFEGPCNTVGMLELDRLLSRMTACLALQLPTS